MRFVRFDGEVFDKDKAEMGIDCDKAPVNLYIDVDRVICVRDDYDDDGYNGCVIYMDSGENFWTPEETEEVLKKIDRSDERAIRS